MLPQAAPRRGGKRRRGNLAAMETVTNRVELALEPSQPFRLDLTALALVRRPSNLIDVWEAGAYRRVVPLGEPGPAAPEAEPVLLEVRSAGKLDGTPFDERLHVSVTGRWSEAELARAGERAATRLLGLDADLSGFYVVAAADERLAPVAERLRGLRPPRYPSVFEALLNAVPCQQVTLVLGLTLLGRLARAYGPEVPFAPVRYLRPTRIERQERRRIQDWWLLLLRALALAVLAFAFARPYVVEALPEQMKVTARARITRLERI